MADMRDVARALKDLHARLRNMPTMDEAAERKIRMEMTILQRLGRQLQVYCTSNVRFLEAIKGLNYTPRPQGTPPRDA